jgi:hypothetical protein
VSHLRSIFCTTQSRLDERSALITPQLLQTGFKLVLATHYEYPDMQQDARRQIRRDLGQITAAARRIDAIDRGADWTALNTKEIPFVTKYV